MPKCQRAVDSFHGLLFKSVAWIIGLLLRTHRFPVYPIARPAVIAALSLTTALPWLASILDR